MKELKLLVYVKTFPIVLFLFTFVYQIDCRRSITGYIPMGLSNDLCDNAKVKAACVSNHRFIYALYNNLYFNS